MGLPDLYPAQVGSPYTTLSAPYTSGESTMTLVDATKLPDAPNIVCLTGDVAGEFKYTGKDGNTLTGVTKLSGTPNATWPAGTYAFRGVSAYDHASIVEHLTFQRSHIVEASLDLTPNLTYSGRVLEGAEAGENLAFGDLAVLAESGKFVKADPATLAADPANRPSGRLPNRAKVARFPAKPPTQFFFGNVPGMFPISQKGGTNHV